eukprot:m.1653051 g.1653051  ORF g.1653051 m.1653051 type:complete len:65 (+) comp95453_c0_seq1:73-267(+)
MQYMHHDCLLALHAVFMPVHHPLHVSIVCVAKYYDVYVICSTRTFCVTFVLMVIFEWKQRRHVW